MRRSICANGVKHIHMKMMKCVREKNVSRHAVAETRMKKKERNQNEKKKRKEEEKKPHKLRTICVRDAQNVAHTHGHTRHDPRSTAEKEQNRYGFVYKYIWRYTQTGIPF